MNTAKQLLAITDDFIAKRLRQNKPFQSLIKSDEFEAFQKQVKQAISAQIKAVSHNLPSASVLAAPGNIQYWVDQNMPHLPEFLDVDETADYLKFCFEWGAKAQYKRFGLKLKMGSSMMQKVDSVDFNLTNELYLRALKQQANYLINLSKIDETTKSQIINIIQSNTEAGLTIDEVADVLSESFDDISDSRAFTIARTETAQAMGSGNYAAMTENGVQTKRWVTAGGDPCDICQTNADDGYIPVDQAFSSGDDYEPAHPNDECYTEAGEIDLESIDIWDGA